METETTSREVKEAEALRVIHIRTPMSLIEALDEADGELLTKGVTAEESRISFGPLLYREAGGGRTITYFFRDTEDLEAFQHILNERGIPYSVHSSEEYEPLLKLR